MVTENACLRREVLALKARDQQSRRLLEDANGWLKNVVIPDALDYDRAKDGLALLIEDIGQHITRKGRSGTGEDLGDGSVGQTGGLGDGS